MQLGHLQALAWVALLSAQQGVPAQEPSPSYARLVRPFLAKYCLECHNAKGAKAGLDLETYKAILKGSDGGEVLVPGKPDDSHLVLLTEGKEKPKMPPKEAKRHPTPKEIGLLRAWVAAGARDDSDLVKSALPDLKPRSPTAPPVTALAYRRDGSMLAAGAHREVVLINPDSGEVAGKITGFDGPVTALAFSRASDCLAVASGGSGEAGRVDHYQISAGKGPTICHTFRGHADVIHAVEFSPDGKRLVTCGYDHLIKIWDVATGKEIRTLKEHSDSVYGVAFRPDGKLLASVAADRAVKVWDADTGKLLYTLGEATDWVYAVVWSPDGKHLAAAGADRSVRVWEIRPDEGRLLHSVFAHEAPVTRLAYSADGRSLYSLGEDRVVKAWDAARMIERHVFPRQPETLLALAVRPDGKQLALGRYDGAALLVDPAGKVLAQPLPVKPKPPAVKSVTPNVGVRGRAITVTFDGSDLDAVSAVSVGHPGATASLLAKDRSPARVRATIRFPADTPPGVYSLTLSGQSGESKVAFTVDPFEPIAEKETNNSPGTGQLIRLPATVTGTMGQMGDVDYFRFEAAAGQQIGAQVLTAVVGSKLDAYLRLTDAAGNTLAESNDGALGYTVAKAGVYAVGVRDREYQGGGARHYRLHLGDIPVATALFPLGLQRGTEAAIHVEGVNLGGKSTVRLKAPADAIPGTQLALPLTAPGGAPLNLRKVVVGEFPEVTSLGAGKILTIPTPGTANGRIDAPGKFETWRFHAKKGERLIVETTARRLGSALDSAIEILTADGKPLPRATLRSLARTYVAFRDHDSAQGNIRIEAWGELAINDYLYVGGELMRIRDLPTHPDADCNFFTDRGQRVGYLDTTPTHHAMGVPMYKVQIHPPGTTFPPNGFPVVTLYHRNDDGGPGYGRDSKITFDPPADGEYLVRVGDSRGQGGSDYAYRLTVRPPRPDFKVTFNPTAPAVWRGGAVPVAVNAERSDGFDGEIRLRLENVPPGFSAPTTSVPAGQNSTAFALFAEASAQDPGQAPPMKLIAEATIDGRTVVKEVAGGLPKVIAPGNIVTATDESEVTLKPGGRVKLTVRVERRNKFGGRIPIDVRGLPHGVKVLDIGLNGILITEAETVRTMVLYAEPWVAPQDHPIVVVARQEGKNTEHAAKSVLLKIQATR